MPIPRLRPPDTALVIIDMQERILASVPDRERIAQNCAVLLRAADALDLPYLVTEQHPRGLGRTIEDVATAMTDQSRRIEKRRFSAASDLLSEHLHAWRRSSVIVAGVEAHTSLLQTVLDLQEAGRQCYVCADAVSATNRLRVDLALRRMERSGAIVGDVVSVLYELLEGADHPVFRVCLELAKLVR